MNKLKFLLINLLFFSQNCFPQNTKIPFDPSDDYDIEFSNSSYISLVSVLIIFIAPYYISKIGKDEGNDGIFWKWFLILFTASFVTHFLFGNKLSLVAMIIISIYGLILKDNEEFESNDSNIIKQKKHKDNEEKINDAIQGKKESRKSAETNLNIEDVTSKDVQFNNSTKEKIKTIPCINCKQKLRLTAVVNKELEITCPKCHHKWVANFKTLL